MAKRPRDPVEREIMDIIPERFDADSASQGARRGAHTRWILSGALGLLLIAAVGVAARHLIVGEGGGPAAGSNIPVIKPDEKPIKTKPGPGDRGGMEVPNQDKLVYQDLGKGDAKPEAEKLMPPAEKPQAPAVKAPPAPPAQETVSAAMPPANKEASGAIPAAPAAPAASAPMSAPAAAPMPAAPPPPPAIAAAPPPSPPPPVAPAKEAAAKPATVAAAAPPPAPTPPAPKAAAAPAKAPAASSTSGWQVQLAAMRSEAEAQTLWKKVQAANKDLLGDSSEEVVRADLGAKGIYYRLRVDVADEAAAKSLCAALAERKQGCIVARK